MKKSVLTAALKYYDTHKPPPRGDIPLDLDEKAFDAEEIKKIRAIYESKEVAALNEDDNLPRREFLDVFEIVENSAKTYGITHAALKNIRQDILKNIQGDIDFAHMFNWIFYSNKNGLEGSVETRQKFCEKYASYITDILDLDYLIREFPDSERFDLVIKYGSGKFGSWMLYTMLTQLLNLIPKDQRFDIIKRFYHEFPLQEMITHSNREIKAESGDRYYGRSEILFLKNLMELLPQNQKINLLDLCAKDINVEIYRIIADLPMEQRAEQTIRYHDKIENLQLAIAGVIMGVKQFETPHWFCEKYFREETNSLAELIEQIPDMYPGKKFLEQAYEKHLSKNLEEYLPHRDVRGVVLSFFYTDKHAKNPNAVQANPDYFEMFLTKPEQEQKSTIDTLVNEFKYPNDDVIVCGARKILESYGVNDLCHIIFSPVRSDQYFDFRKELTQQLNKVGYEKYRYTVGVLFNTAVFVIDRTERSIHCVDVAFNVSKAQDHAHEKLEMVTKQDWVPRLKNYKLIEPSSELIVARQRDNENRSGGNDSKEASSSKNFPVLAIISLVGMILPKEGILVEQAPSYKGLGSLVCPVDLTKQEGLARKSIGQLHIWLGAALLAYKAYREELTQQPTQQSNPESKRGPS